MLELSPQNVADYLRTAGRITNHPADTPPASPAGEILIQSLSGGIANVVLKIFDPLAGPNVGTDTRSPAQIKRNAPDLRPHRGECFVLKQPLPRFRTDAEWLVDIDRIRVERDAIALCSSLLPPGSVPDVLWFDESNYVLALACAPLDSLLWKKQLLTGYVSADAAQLAGTMLAILHSSTLRDSQVAARYSDPKFFIQQRTDPYLAHLKTKHPDLAPTLDHVIRDLLATRLCLIHGDFSPKNIFLVPRAPDAPPPPQLPRKGRLHPDNPLAKGQPPKPKRFDLSHLLLLDFEVCFYGHPGFDVATLINHLLLKSFHQGSRHAANWQPTMIAIDAFWQTYLHTAEQSLAALVERSAGHILASLLLRIDGKSPVEYITDEPLKQKIRATGRTILADPAAAALEPALDHAATALMPPATPA